MSVVGPVIQAIGRLSFEYDLKSGGLLYCVFHRKSASALSLLTVWSKSSWFADQNWQIIDNVDLGVRYNSNRGLSKLPCLEPAVIL